MKTLIEMFRNNLLGEKHVIRGLEGIQVEDRKYLCNLSVYD